MTHIVSSRTPEGEPNRCFLCGSVISIEPSVPPGDAPCPNCGQLVWFAIQKLGNERAPLLLQILREHLGMDLNSLSRGSRFLEDIGADSLDMVELVMALEEEFDLTIPDAEAERIRTVGEAIEAIERLLRNK
jgi:acyl carrier protein